MPEGQEAGVQERASQEGATQEGTEGQQTLEAADVQQQVSALQQELAALKAQSEADRRAMQGKIDKDIARVEKQRGAERQALQAFVKGRLEAGGATSEELSEFEQEYGRFTEGLSDREKAQLYEEVMADRKEEGQIREAQEEMIKGIAEAFEVEIPPNHPDLNKDDPRSLQKSALKVAQKLAAEKAKKGEKDALTQAAETGALSALGTGPGGVVNPLAGITDPEELRKIWEKQGKKIPKPSE